jgi:hypothetical protein
MMIGELSGIAPGHDSDETDDSLESRDMAERADRQDSSDPDSRLTSRAGSGIPPPPVAIRRRGPA